MKLTAKAVEKLRHEGDQPFRDVKDEITRNLYLRIWRSGEKRWILRYKVTRQVRVGTIGDAATVGLADARRIAAEWHARIKAGRDPAREAATAAAEEQRRPTVAGFASEYLERHSKPNKRTWRQDERLLAHDVLPAIGQLRIDRVERRDIVLLVDAIRDRGAHVLANRTLALLRQLFRFAIERGVIEEVPFSLRATRETARARVLTEDELASLWAATEAHAGGAEPATRWALRLLVLTAARASEVAGVTWQEVDFDGRLWQLPGARTKNGCDHSVPLSEPALAVLHEAATMQSGPWVLPATRGSGHVTIGGLLNALQRIVPGARLHDLRRTAATGLQKLGIRLEVTEGVLNHISGSRAGVVGIYQRHDWAVEKRAALEAWARRIEQLAAGEQEGGNSTPLVRAA